ncbi:MULTISPECIES: N-acetylmuramoyl-L-alanine amidase [Streptomyces]|uniref:N-acetylmuramoyl-L-alanine amidase n=2 Tax=Streptomyces TaxID=1883 RepID=A0A3R7EYS5_9ACTN|nr:MULTISPECIES: N-acetylmuramoyl-L-alanine amidase [Streptomyces]KNE80327.1 N-acetylmuramoyl-L-alanine amidase [Streptomyces fradiae]OFA42617.1 N-acetylmuramoyl-L-alanine amidase [Streptomyces fradiae]PQM24926.1 N-acetylmuramoyl-L-alanine amidase [Streptomyces xinghaiensis]RKM98977.1 N-acetylmuramoyl-L-alanine amidase [Streptomyces xinghaiensis]RNC76120.1 N-acetylmuramoyl-L-alanine amidase [Streptomyces xinghaiensis]
MATPLSASRLLAAIKAEGCKVVEYKSWRTHNRNHKGPWGPVYGVMIHHTVTSGTDSSVALCYNGHSSLPGPLCHTVGAKNGTLYMVGNGRANHAGAGDDDVLRAVIDERALPADNEANTDGNRYFYGIELINLGNGRDPWPEPQLDAAARWAAAICRAHGWNERSVIGHLEWQPGKVDPRGFTMSSFRSRVKALLSRPPGQDNTAPEDDVPLYLSLGMHKEFTMVPGTWYSVAWDQEWSDPLKHHAAGGRTFATNCQYNGVASIRVRGLTPGRELQARIVEDDASGDTVQHHPIGETAGTAGSTFLAFPFSGKARKDRKIKLQIAHYGEEPVTVEKSYLKAQVWPN